MSSSNCCFLTCIQVSQESGQVVWYARLFQSFPQFIVIHTIEGFGVVSKAEILLNHKKNETVPFAAAWMDLEIIILKQSGRERQIFYGITYVESQI